MRDFSYGITALADSLMMDLKRNDRKLSGHNTIMLPNVLPNTSHCMAVNVVDSLVDDFNDIAAVLVHFGGGLFAILIAEGRGEPRIKMMFLDGKKLGFTKQLLNKGKVKLFGNSWTRVNTYRRIVEGITRGFWRPLHNDVWQEVEEPRERIKKYVEGRDSGLSSKEAAKFSGDYETPEQLEKDFLKSYQVKGN